jgi:hypothetical protein
MRRTVRPMRKRHALFIHTRAVTVAGMSSAYALRVSAMVLSAADLITHSAIMTRGRRQRPRRPQDRPVTRCFDVASN